MAWEESGTETMNGAGGPRGKGRMGGDEVGSGERGRTRKGRKKSTERRGQRSRTWSPKGRGKTETTKFESVGIKQEVVSEDERKRAKVQQIKLPLEDWK